MREDGARYEGRQGDERDPPGLSQCHVEPNRSYYCQSGAYNHELLGREEGGTLLSQGQYHRLVELCFRKVHKCQDVAAIVRTLCALVDIGPTLSLPSSFESKGCRTPPGDGKAHDSESRKARKGTSGPDRVADPDRPG